MGHRIIIYRTSRCEIWDAKVRKRSLERLSVTYSLNREINNLFFFPFVKNYGEINTAFMSLSYNFVQ